MADAKTFSLSQKEYLEKTEQLYFEGIESGFDPGLLRDLGGGLALAGKDSDVARAHKGGILGALNMLRSPAERDKVAAGLWSKHRASIVRRIKEGVDVERAVWEHVLVETGATGHFTPLELATATSLGMSAGRSVSRWRDRVLTMHDQVASDLQIAGHTLAAGAAVVSYGLARLVPGGNADKDFRAAIKVAHVTRPVLDILGAAAAPYQHRQTLPHSEAPVSRRDPQAEVSGLQSMRLGATAPRPGPRERSLGTATSRQPAIPRQGVRPEVPRPPSLPQREPLDDVISSTAPSRQPTLAVDERLTVSERGIRQGQPSSRSQRRSTAQNAVDGAALVDRDKGRLATFKYNRAGSVRSILNQRAVDAEAAHILPQIVGRRLKALGFPWSAGKALTVPLPHETHSAFDGIWLDQLRPAINSANRGGPPVRVADVERILSGAISSMHPSLMGDAEKGTIGWMLERELQEIGASSSTILWP